MSAITAEFRRSALREGVIVRSKRATRVEDKFRLAICAEMLGLGYVVDPSDLEGMSLTALGNLITDARAVMGADRNHTPFYPGFPDQVAEMDTLDLLMDQILHYFSGGALRATGTGEVRPALDVRDAVRRAVPLRVEVASDAARAVITDLLARPIALSSQERSLLDSAMDLLTPDAGEVAAMISSCTHRENASYAVRTASLRVPARDLALAIFPDVREVDGLLRMVLALFTRPSAPEHEQSYDLAVDALSDADAFAVAMESMPRAVRRALMDRLGEISSGFRADALVSRQGLWRRVMRSVHPYSLNLSEESRRAADIVHGNISYRTLASHVEDAVGRGDIVEVVSLLGDRPGMLLRRLVHLVSLADSKADVKTLSGAIRAKGAGAPLSTLISACNGVMQAGWDGTKVTRVSGLSNTMRAGADQKIPPAHIKMITDALREAMGVKFDAMDAPDSPVATGGNAPMPLVRRDVSVTDRTIDRGARLNPMGEGETIRLFVHWYNQDNRHVDLDLGAQMLDEKFDLISTVTWNSWSGNRSYATYSGDIITAPRPRGAAEFIDVDPAALRKVHPNARYVVMTVLSFNGQHFDAVDNVCGAMMRSATSSGEIFDPRTVTTAFTSSSKSTVAVPLVFDLDTGEIVWIDSSTGSEYGGRSAAGDQSIGQVVRFEMQAPRMSASEIAKMWADAHGVETDPSTPADTDLLVNLLG